MQITNKDVVKYITYVKVNYPKAFVFSGTTEQINNCKATLISSWYDILKDYPKEVCELGVKNAVKNFDFGDYPKICDIVKEIKKLQKAYSKDVGELWNEFMSIKYKVSRLAYNLHFDYREENGLTQGENAQIALENIFDNLSPELKRYFVNWGGMVETARLDDNALQFEKKTFFRIVKEQNERALIRDENPELKKALELGNNDLKLLEKIK